MNKLIFTLAAIALFAGAVHLMTAQSTVALQASTPDHIVNEFTQWKSIYGRKYASADHEYFRLRVFQDNYNMIVNHNAKNEETYTMAPNQFMDMTQEEFVQTYLNLVVPEHKMNVEEVATNGVPNAVNWVSAGKVSAVKNQGSCGSCWAFSAVAALESRERIANTGTTSFSEQQLVDCSRSYGNQGCNGGWMDQAFAFVKDHGITDTGSYGYVARDQACKKTDGAYKITGYKDSAEGNCNAVISDLGGRPLSVAVDATNWSFYAGGVFRNCAKNLNHGVLLVGVDASGTWNIKNSWGGSWGNSGFISLASGNTCGICNSASYPY